MEIRTIREHLCLGETHILQLDGFPVPGRLSLRELCSKFYGFERKKSAGIERGVKGGRGHWPHGPCAMVKAQVVLR